MSSALIESTTCRLKRYSALEYLLLGDIREILEEDLDDENRRWLLVILDALLEMLPREFQLKEEGGYLTEVVECYPNWTNQVDDLRYEQTTLLEELSQLRADVACLKLAYVRTETVRVSLKNWTNSLTAHRRHETRLIQVAVNLEVGVGD